MKMKNNRHWIALATVAAAAILLALALWPLGPQTPASLPPITPADAEQEPFLRQLQLGWRYEQLSDWENAQAAYAEAALANQAEIALQARNGIYRILQYQQSLLFRLQQTARSFALVWLALSALLLAQLWLTRPTQNPGYLLQPFEDYTEEKIGAGLHALIQYYIQEAHNAHQQGRTHLLGFATAEFPLFATLTESNDELTDTLASLEAVNVGGIEVPFGKLANTIRQQFQPKPRKIGGNVQQLGNQIYLEAQIWASDANVQAARWELSRAAAIPQDALASLAEELAYRLLYHIGQASPRPFEAGSWRSLMLFTQGLRLLQTEPQDNLRAQLEQARALFEEAATLDPGFLMAQYALGITLTRLAEYEKARAQFDEIIEAQRHLVLEATYNLGLTFYHEFRPWAYEKAKSCYQKVVEQTADAATPNHQLLRALAYAGIANTAAQMIGEDVILHNRSIDEILGEVEKNCQAAAQQLAPIAADHQARFVQALIHNARGIAAYYAEDLPQAKNQLRSALREQPDNLVAYGYLALVALKEYDETQALAWFDRTLEWNPAQRYIEYFYYKFGRYFHLGEDWSRAKDYYAQAPNHPFAVNYLGEVYAQTGHLAQALALFRQATQLNRKIAEFWLNLAYSITKMEDASLLPEALEAANRAASLQNDWRSRDVLGWVYFQMGNYPEAERQLYNSIRLHEQIVQNHYHLACVFWAQKNRNKALEMIEKGFATADKSTKWRKRAAELRQEIMQASAP